ncbi:FCD domain-containing protein [Xylophilus rhododendri]|uniref:FCD domain-containing protein n=1 Tax=Xylophilus rhododendri TaxID=2697032 RepID=A0A857JCQ4_9BURK|nr:GntR family transcriptional regulator [Xylophilus rhododendri]QHJ00880.1 FCD domain-containing protein [Xylophilus rhododendri]
MLAHRPPPFEHGHSTAQEEAYQHIRQAIRMGTMRPGYRLVPDEIANAIGMSRMPVREALNRLAAEGLIVLRPNRGAVVRGLTEKEVREVFEMRAVLEGLAASMAVSRVTPADLLDLEQLLIRMRNSAANTADWITEHRQFHERFCAIADAPRLMHQIAALHLVVEPLMRLWLENRSSSAYLQDVHEELVATLKAGDAAHMEAMMRAHVLRTVPGITAAMREQGAQAG